MRGKTNPARGCTVRAMERGLYPYVKLYPAFGSELWPAGGRACRAGHHVRWVSTSGARVGEFEQALADYVGMPRAVAANSGSSALHLAALAAGIRRGEEVIVPTLTFIAAVNPLTPLCRRAAGLYRL